MSYILRDEIYILLNKFLIVSFQNLEVDCYRANSSVAAKKLGN